MERSTASAKAGQVGVMVTNDGVHPPEKWAALTCEQLVEVSQSMPPERRPLAEALRKHIYAVLIAVFNEVRGDLTAGDIDRIARQAIDRCVDLARGTPWQLSFTAPVTKEMLLVTLRRNLFSAADIALKTE